MEKPRNVCGWYHPEHGWIPEGLTLEQYLAEQALDAVAREMLWSMREGDYDPEEDDQ